MTLIHFPPTITTQRKITVPKLTLTHQLKRQHSFEPPHTSASPAARAQSKSNSPTESTPPALLTNAVYDPKTSTQQDLNDPWPATNVNQDSWGEQEKDLWGGAGGTLRKEEDQAIIGSPLKKQRASMSGDNEFKARVSSLGAVSSSLGGVMGLGFLSDVTGGATGAGSVEFGGELKRVDETAGGMGSAVDGVGVGVGVGVEGGEASGLNHLGAVGGAPVKADAMEEEEL